MSSHREAPSISKDPVADNTDTYAFRTPGDTVTLITNYLPAQTPAGGPNFYEFGDDVLYEIKIDNNGNGRPNVIYQFRFKTVITNPNTFLYNTGPITALDSPNWNRKQTYDVTKVTFDSRGRPRTRKIGSSIPAPPCNIGPRSTPDYPSLAQAAVRVLPTGEKVFAGQRAEGFFVDLGSIFDLGTLRPFQAAHLIPERVLAWRGLPRGDQRPHDRDPGPHPRPDAQRVHAHGRAGARVGHRVWGSASRQKATTRRPGKGGSSSLGSWVQVSRLGNPLFNEVVVPMARKDEWNAQGPDQDSKYAQYVAQPELAKLLPVLYPSPTFDNLAGLTADRADLLAILLTGIPAGLIDGFQNYTGPTQADELRLNVAVPPTATPNRLGLAAGDAAGFPNGRRVTDDVVTVELRAVAGLLYPLVDPSYTVDGAAAAIEDGTFATLERSFLPDFPYLGHPYSGYDVPAAS